MEDDQQLSEKQRDPDDRDNEHDSSQQVHVNGSAHPFAFPYTPHLRPGIIPYVPKLAMLTGGLGLRNDEAELFILLGNARADAFDHASIYADPDEGYGRLILNNDIVIDNFGSQHTDAKSDVRISMSDFTYISELGRGEQGRIFLARHVPSDTTMAIKEIPLEMSQKQMKNILVELEVLSNNKSLYIIDFFGAFYTRSSVYFCMEVMDLGSVGDLIKMLRASKDPYPTFPDSFLGAIIYCISHGLNFLSKKLHIIHRDVKPTNILMNKQGEIKLCDFGVSGYLVKSAAKTYVGSMTYMAPERVRSNQSGDYTIQADVWSLGATLYELVLGSPLYAVSGYDSAFAHLMAISVEPCPEIPDHACSPAMKELIQSFLSKKPNERPTFEELLNHPLVEPYSDHTKMKAAVVDFVSTTLPELILRHIEEWHID